MGKLWIKMEELLGMGLQMDSLMGKAKLVIVMAQMVEKGSQMRMLID